MTTYTPFSKTTLPSEIAKTPIASWGRSDIETHFNKPLRGVKELWACINGQDAGTDGNGNALTNYTGVGIIDKFNDILDNGNLGVATSINIAKSTGVSAGDRYLKFFQASTTVWKGWKWNNTDSAMEATSNAGTLQIIRGATPVNTTDLTTKSYVDSNNLLKWGGGISSRSSDTTLVAADAGKLIVATSAFTQTITAKANLSAGWYVDYTNASTGVIVLDANSSETINGYIKIEIMPGEQLTLWYDGTNLLTFNRSQLAFIQSQTLSGTSTSITIGMGVKNASANDHYKFTNYLLFLNNPIVGTNDTNVHFNFRTNSAIINSAGTYAWNQDHMTTTSTVTGSASDTKIPLSGQGTTAGTMHSNNSGGLGVFEIILTDTAAGQNMGAAIRGEYSYYKATGGAFASNKTFGRLAESTSQTVGGITLSPSSGSWQQGSMTLMGIRTNAV